MKLFPFPIPTAFLIATLLYGPAKVSSCTCSVPPPTVVRLDKTTAIVQWEASSERSLYYEVHVHYVERDDGVNNCEGIKLEERLTVKGLAVEGLGRVHMDGISVLEHLSSSRAYCVAVGATRHCSFFFKKWECSYISDWKRLPQDDNEGESLSNSDIIGLSVAITNPISAIIGAIIGAVIGVCCKRKCKKSVRGHVIPANDSEHLPILGSSSGSSSSSGSVPSSASAVT